jgi:hypothetical protein
MTSNQNDAMGIENLSPALQIHAQLGQAEMLGQAETMGNEEALGQAETTGNEETLGQTETTEPITPTAQQQTKIWAVVIILIISVILFILVLYFFDDLTIFTWNWIVFFCSFVLDNTLFRCLFFFPICVCLIVSIFWNISMIFQSLLEAFLSVGLPRISGTSFWTSCCISYVSSLELLKHIGVLLGRGTKGIYLVTLSTLSPSYLLSEIVVVKIWSGWKKVVSKEGAVLAILLILFLFLCPFICIDKLIISSQIFEGDQHCDAVQPKVLTRRVLLDILGSFGVCQNFSKAHVDMDLWRHCSLRKSSWRTWLPQVCYDQVEKEIESFRDQGLLMEQVLFQVPTKLAQTAGNCMRNFTDSWNPWLDEAFVEVCVEEALELMPCYKTQYFLFAYIPLHGLLPVLDSFSQQVSNLKISLAGITLETPSIRSSSNSRIPLVAERQINWSFFSRLIRPQSAVDELEKKARMELPPICWWNYLSPDTNLTNCENMCQLNACSENRQCLNHCIVELAAMGILDTTEIPSHLGKGCSLITKRE